MNEFTIDYNNGVTQKLDVPDLQSVKEHVKLSASRTDCDITIHDKSGELVTTSRWYGMGATDEDYVLLDFGQYGFYQLWDDELAEI